VTRQIDSVFSDLAVAAVKIGMLSQPGVIAAVADGIKRYGQNLVVLDPVMVATSGDRLLAPEAVAALKQRLLPLARLITPNLPEAAALTETPLARNEAAMRTQAEKLIAMGAHAVLIKGGHGDGPECVDLLAEGGAISRFAAPRQAVTNTHGTGCTLSSAIAAGLARGEGLADAVGAAKSYITAAIAAGGRLGVGHGHGPVHHFHRWW
jgi:hydroxymethylpyrimidine/phosphomethylpyrimidine kinase